VRGAVVKVLEKHHDGWWKVRSVEATAHLISHSSSELG